MRINRKLKASLSLVVLTLSIAFVIYFFATHPGALSQLSHLRIGTILALLVLDALGLAILAIILVMSVVLCGVKIPAKDSFIVTGYASIINFFGPLQSGPAFRVLYLRDRYAVSIKKYVFMTLVYYGLYAMVSAIFLCLYTLPLWQTTLAVVIIAGFVGLVLRSRSKKVSDLHIRVRPLAFLAIATVAQVVVQACSYFIEVRTVDAHVHLAQIITYTGAANFSLFVALTPGAIGFRESFLIFSQHLHHISTSTILAANIIDRSVYILFLLLLAIPIVGMHATDKLLNKKQRPADSSAGNVK